MIERKECIDQGSETEELRLKLAEIKEKCKMVISESQHEECSTSKIWRSVLPYFEYIFDLKPENLLNIRLHTELITGRGVYSHMHKTYRFYESDELKETIPMIQQYQYYNAGIPSEYWCSEPVTTPLLEAVGVAYKGMLVNEDIARYQSCISNLYRLGVFRKMKKQDDRPVIVEIGGGYGGLTCQLSRILNQVPTFIIVDLPEILIWSSTYFTANNPEAKIAIPNRNDAAEILANIHDYDAVFIPNYLLGELINAAECDLFINMLSFQEMTPDQIGDYLSYAKSKCRGVVYLDNFRRHWLNEELKISIANYYDQYLDIIPAVDAYDHSQEDKIQRINLLCKYIGLSKNFNYELDPIDKFIYGEHYKVRIKTGEVLIGSDI